MSTIQDFYNWINERHAIYQRRVRGDQPPWTEDEILSKYKFTNPFRENDKVTIWMRNNWTKPHHNRSYEEMIFNCCLFRMIGTIEFADHHGWVTDWDPVFTKEVIKMRLSKGLRTFTGAYIITNQGLKAPKAEVVVDYFLTPIWEASETLAKIAIDTNSLQKVHHAMGKYKGWGGGGFMSYEVVTDLYYTPVLDKAEDNFTWANAGPGAKRGLNRINERPLNQSINQTQANKEMFDIWKMADLYIGNHIPLDKVDMRTLAPSLCEWDKYERVRLGQGKPRSVYTPTMFSSVSKGAVE